MKSSSKLLSYILVLLSVVTLSSCHSKKNVSHPDYLAGTSKPSETEYGSENGSDGWNYYSNLVIDEAKTWLGTPYKYGGSAKKKGTDCSGMTQQVYLSVTGVEIPRNSARQSEYCKKVSKKKVLPGDLVFFNTSGKGVSHVGIYLGNSCMIHASGGKGVMISSLTEQYWQNSFLCCGRVPQMEILAQNYTPKNQKDSKKSKDNKKAKDKNKKKNLNNNNDEPINVPTPETPITSEVMESEYAENTSSSGPSPDEYSSNHYATNWNETVENATYTSDYVATARFKTKPTLPVSAPTQKAQPEFASTNTSAPGSNTNTVNSKPASSSNSTLTPPSQHSEVFANYDQYGGTNISTQPSLEVKTQKDKTERLYEEAVSTRIDNNVEITSVTSTANIPSDGQQKKAISPAEAFAKHNTSSTSNKITTPAPTTTPKSIGAHPSTVIDNDEEEENPWMD